MRIGAPPARCLPDPRPAGAPGPVSRPRSHDVGRMPEGTHQNRHRRLPPTPTPACRIHALRAAPGGARGGQAVPAHPRLPDPRPAGRTWRCPHGPGGTCPPPPAGSTPCGPHREVPAGARRYLPTPPPAHTHPRLPDPRLAGRTGAGFTPPIAGRAGRTPAVGVGGRRRPNRQADSRPATPHGRSHARIAGRTHARRPVRIFMTGPDQLNICPGGDLWPFFSVFFSTVNLFSEGSIDSLIAVLMA